MSNDLARMKELIQLLNDASKAYYQLDQEIMSNFEYDKYYDELVGLEKRTSMVLSDSPTVHVGYEAVTELPKERHEKPMLSLGKTKSREELKSFLGSQNALLSWKLDGLTIVLTYREGTLYKAVTRGNGEVGEVITNNARVFQNIPHRIPYQGELILRGEAVITYDEFERINQEIEDVDAKYKNPRNLCSGSVRQLNNQITAERKVTFFAFALVKADMVDFSNSRKEQYDWLKKQGFDVVEHKIVNAENLFEEMDSFANNIGENSFPSDGLVLLYDDISYGDSLGMTAKFPRNAMAFKWQDETAETILRSIEWSPSRTGLINPVAIFDSVSLEGTSVSRASVHNISIMKAMHLGVGDVITVYKANMIIPQIADNLTNSGNIEIPEYCPVCGAQTIVEKKNDVETLICPNPECQAKRVKAFALFASRDAMNIEGLSEQTLEKLIGRGFIHEFSDIYHLSQYQSEIKQMEGFGEKSYDNLIANIEKSRHTVLYKLIYGLGIPNIGVANAKMICRHFQNNFEKIKNASVEELSAIEGVGSVIAELFQAFFQNPDYLQKANHVFSELVLMTEDTSPQNQIFAGKTFVITGNVLHFDNRSALKDYIETLGGKATGSVTSKTDYLINNDVESSSSKNKKAKELGIPILSEEEFLKLLGE